MASKEVLRGWVLEALRELGGAARVLDVSKHVWQRHEGDLAMLGDLFYTWQYDIRWAAQELRNTGFLERLDGDRSGVWRLAASAGGSSVQVSPAPTAAGADWTAAEIAVVLESYMRMLRAESDGRVYTKTVENRFVVEQTGRSRGAVEFKFANISAVLDELGHTYVRGYKPRSNVQDELRYAVKHWMRRRDG